MTDNPAHADVKEGAVNDQPARPTRAERIKQAVHDKVQSGENSKKIADAVEHVREQGVHETAREVSDRFVQAAGAAPGQMEGALFNFSNRYGKESAADIIVPTFNKGVQATRERVNEGRRSANLQPTFSSTKGRPTSARTKGRPTSARIFKYSGAVDAHPHVHGAGQPNFSMGAHPVNFGQGSALPHGAAGGSGTPTTGSAVNFGNLHGFGGIAHTSMSTPSFGMNDGILKGAGVGAGVRTGGSTFGLNDGVLKSAAIGKLNFTQGVLAKNKSKYAKKKSKK